ncbi:MAG: hypothetical protein JWL59_3964 [Chthoniobacteraceae bacterium]|nr:hypothetical protein [Chthoniobacteraceae bacterium]
MNFRSSRCVILLVIVLGLAGCATTNSQMLQSGRATMNAAIRAEAPGKYYIARRYYKQDYKFWGFVRQPGQPWSSAKLVMLNEQLKLAPDRETGHIGDDNNYEYKLLGDFSGQSVYEPASNGIYPEFILKGYELRSKTPGSIYRTPGATDPSRRVIAMPY